MQYILTYSKHEQAVYLVFSRGVFRALSSISDQAFVKKVNGFISLTIFAKNFHLEMLKGSEYTEAVQKQSPEVLCKKMCS